MVVQKDLNATFFSKNNMDTIIYMYILWRNRHCRGSSPNGKALERV